ncbi:ABC transporter permease [Sphingomonas sanxanigenens]|uniref:ABC-2 type transporter domain-containing protein n=1 Tax=Sphingomonas sanxanigenens DSM 19645 = NX02 TaxID=1123269 RepID=W0AFE9_9SPHN|nr:ABC transporter permease [Sphingomonas sanxanigenens]AHE55841.1 hypothetical protein NX02_21000 [Sphingomonas sanxanigenens DSM 19645 = NX02]
MIADAIRAELFRARRNRVMLFWAYGFVPLFALLLGVALENVMRVEDAGLLGAANPVALAMRGLNAAGNPIAALFYAIGAASLFAGDYRYESWRLATPRNRRANLILGKVAVFAMFAAVSLLLSMLADVLSGLYQPLRYGSAVMWPAGAGWIGALAAGFAGSLLEMLVVAAMAGLGAVATRSLLGGALPAFLLALAQSMALGFVSRGPALDRYLLAPAQAGDAVRGWAAGGVPNEVALAGAGVLVLWLVVLVAGTAMLFERQDLARE